MADPVTATIFAVATIASVGTKIIGGIAADKASKKEANLLRDQALLSQEEAHAEAQRVANQNRKFLKRQKLAYLKNGVTLEGSPLLIQDETLQEGQEEVTSISRAGEARAGLFSERANIVRREGRAKLIGSIGGGVADVFNAFGKGQQEGIFN